MEERAGERRRRCYSRGEGVKHRAKQIPDVSRHKSYCCQPRNEHYTLLKEIVLPRRLPLHPNSPQTPASRAHVDGLTALVIDRHGDLKVERGIGRAVAKDAPDRPAHRVFPGQAQLQFTMLRVVVECDRHGRGPVQALELLLIADFLFVVVGPDQVRVLPHRVGNPRRQGGREHHEPRDDGMRPERTGSFGGGGVHGWLRFQFNAADRRSRWSRFQAAGLSSKR